MEKNRIRLKIGGSEFNLTTPDEPEYVEGLAAKVNDKMNLFSKQAPRLSVTMAAILAALDYCDAYQKSEEAADKLRSQMKDYLEDSARARMEADVVRREVERLNRELQQLRAQNASGKNQAHGQGHKQ